MQGKRVPYLRPSASLPPPSPRDARSDVIDVHHISINASFAWNFIEFGTDVGRPIEYLKPMTSHNGRLWNYQAEMEQETDQLIG